MAVKKKVAEDKADIGHNSIDKEYMVEQVERIEKLQAKKQELQGDISDIFSVLKGKGYDVKTIREMIKFRKMDEQVRQEHFMMLETYFRAAGMGDLF